MCTKVKNIALKKNFVSQRGFHCVPWLEKALMRENKFPNEEVKAEVIKLLCNGQDGSLSTASDNPTQNPPSRRTTGESAGPEDVKDISLHITLCTPTKSPPATPKTATPPRNLRSLHPYSKWIIG